MSYALTLEREEGRSIDWMRAIMAGLIATVVITVSMALFGTNIMKMLGGMILGQGASPLMQYLVGGAIHFMVGLFYGVAYAFLFGPIRVWHPLLKGAVFGTAITALALAMMPVMAAMIGGGASGPGNPCGGMAAGASNPCSPQAAANPCNPKSAANPCNSCSPIAANPCNPDPGKDADAQGAANPCNPAVGAGNPCSPAAAVNPCAGAAGGAANPCNPCGGGGGAYAGLISLVNHLIYGIVLALIYGMGASGASGRDESHA